MSKIKKILSKIGDKIVNLKTRTIVIIAFVAIIGGTLLISADYLEGKKELAYQTISISLYNEAQDNTPQNLTEEETDDESETESVTSENTNGYLGILTIDKINLTQGFYDKDNEHNNVSENLTFLEPSNYPDEEGGNVILVAHSGVTRIAYFRNLYQLEVGDTAKIEYNGKTYTYIIDDIYNEEKDGDVTIYRDTTRQTLTMITCTKDSDTEQTIYIAYLESVQ